MGVVTDIGGAGDMRPKRPQRGPAGYFAEGFPALFLEFPGRSAKARPRVAEGLRAANPVQRPARAARGLYLLIVLVFLGRLLVLRPLLTSGYAQAASG